MFAVLGSLALGACVEDAWRDWQGRGDAAVPDAGSDGGVADAGTMPDAGLIDSGFDGGVSSDAGTTLDAGLPCDAGACTSDWNTFQRCGSIGQALCVPLPSGFQALTHWAFHGPASGVSGSALALADNTNVSLLTAQKGGVQLLRTNSGITATGLAVSDWHNETFLPGCVDAFISLSTGPGLMSTLFAACADGGGLVDYSFTKPFTAVSASSLPFSAAAPTDLGVAGGSETTYVGESGVPVSNLPLSTSVIQGLSGGPVTSCTAVNDDNWWVFLNAGVLAYSSACSDAIVTDFSVPATLVLDAGVRMTARDEGGVVVVSVNGTQVVGAEISQTLAVGSVATLDLTCPNFVPSDVEIGQWGSGTTLTRVVLLDGSNGQAYVTDLTTGLGGSASWSSNVVQAGPPGMVFAAPMYPNMLFEVEDGGTPRIVWIPL